MKGLLVRVSSPHLFSFGGNSFEHFADNVSQSPFLLSFLLVSSTEQATRAQLDDYKNLLRAMEEVVKQKELKRGVVAEALKKAKAENKALKAKSDRLKTQNESVVEYYNHLRVEDKSPPARS